MPSLEQMAPWDEKKTRKVQVTNPNGLKYTLEITYYPNRISQEGFQKHDTGDDTPEDENADDPSADVVWFCTVYHDWDVTGPLIDRRDGTVLVERDDQVIPMKPEFVRWVQPWLRVDINRQISEIEFPNPNGSRRSRRR